MFEFPWCRVLDFNIQIYFYLKLFDSDSYYYKVNVERPKLKRTTWTFQKAESMLSVSVSRIKNVESKLVVGGVHI